MKVVNTFCKDPLDLKHVKTGVAYEVVIIFNKNLLDLKHVTT